MLAIFATVTRRAKARSCAWGAKAPVTHDEKNGRGLPFIGVVQDSSLAGLAYATFVLRKPVTNLKAPSHPLNAQPLPSSESTRISLRGLTRNPLSQKLVCLTERVRSCNAAPSMKRAWRANARQIQSRRKADNSRCICQHAAHMTSKGQTKAQESLY